MLGQYFLLEQLGKLGVLCTESNRGMSLYLCIEKARLEALIRAFQLSCSPSLWLAVSPGLGLKVGHYLSPLQATLCGAEAASSCLFPFLPRSQSHLWKAWKSASVQFSSVAQSCPTLHDPMDRSMSSLPVHRQLPESTQTHVHWVSDAIQPSHPLSSPSPPALNLSQHQGLFQWVSSSHQVAQLLEFQLQHQFHQWTPRTDLL